MSRLFFAALSTYYRLGESAVRFCHAKPDLFPWTPEPEAAKPPAVRRRRT